MTPSHPDSSPEMNKLKQLVEGIQFAMLTTVNPNGRLHSRPMSTLEIDPTSSTLWFFSSEPSPKTEELAVESHVNVAYSSSDGHRYVSVSGVATLVHDRAKMQELWKEVYRVWFPQGLNDPKLCLIRVDMEEAQYWDSPGKIAKLLEFARAYLTQEKAELGETRKLSFH